MGSLPLDYAALMSDALLQQSKSSIADQITNHPERTLNSIALAFHTVRTLSFYTVYINVRIVHILYE